MGVTAAFFDKIPYVATMAPIVEDVAVEAPDAATGRALWWAFALGADFGGNGTAVAARANVVALGIAARTGHRITFWQFTKYGIVVTLFSTVLACIRLDPLFRPAAGTGYGSMRPARMA